MASKAEIEAAAIAWCAYSVPCPGKACEYCKRRAKAALEAAERVRQQPLSSPLESK